MSDEIHPGCRAMLERLFARKTIGGKHPPEDYILRCLQLYPPRERKAALKDWEKCKKQGLVLTKQKPTRLHVSLNPKKILEVKKLTRKQNEKPPHLIQELFVKHLEQHHEIKYLRCSSNYVQ